MTSSFDILSRQNRSIKIDLNKQLTDKLLGQNVCLLWIGQHIRLRSSFGMMVLSLPHRYMMADRPLHGVHMAQEHMADTQFRYTNRR